MSNFVKKLTKAIDATQKSDSVDGVKSKAFTSEYLMGSSVKKHASAKPVTTSDKLMSDEHKRRRGEVDQIKSHIGRLTASIKYNELHMNEHAKALKKTKSLLSSHMAGQIAGKFLSKGY
jgi:SMC interacting uncharacterized protein involved in chromosome segregation